jgi:biopolymer transport protein ExbB/TolQ
MRLTLFALLIVMTMPFTVIAQPPDSAAIDTLQAAEGDTTLVPDSSEAVVEDVLPETVAAIEEEPEEPEETGGFFSQFANFFRQGGPAMWAILLFFFTGIVIFVERLVFLYSTASVKPEAFMARIADLIRRGSIEGAIAEATRYKAPLSRIIDAALRNYRGTERDIQNAVDEMALAELPRINARISYLAMLANVSTMVGLLGTIFGLIAAFAAVAAADPEQKSVMLANGISQAMNTTAFGLISAIPLLIVHSLLTSRADKLVDQIDRYSVMVMNMLAAARKGD